jgi:hypothetical protein
MFIVVSGNIKCNVIIFESTLCSACHKAAERKSAVFINAVA